jgi:phenylalanyl-tRNA synthetase alpha chain
MKETLLKIEKETLEKLLVAATESEVLKIKSDVLGKEGSFSLITKGLKDLEQDKRKEFGMLTSSMKNKLEESINAKLEDIRAKATKKVLFDNTLPIDEQIGSLSPVTIVAKKVTDALTKMGFIVVTGPEKEDDYHNFEALNVPKDHPARDMQDTYWLSDGDLLRTQTSACQVRAMEKYGAPLRIAAPGRCFRNEDIDACHENTFFQLEGMVIDENVSINNLIYVMKNILKEVFEQQVEVRLRPGFFPFVEPGFELDVKCLICGGDGCPTCKNSGWLELLPCGMVHPNVLKMSGIDAEKYTGFAFGIGLTRLAMMKYKIKDIRELNSGDIRALGRYGIN